MLTLEKAYKMIEASQNKAKELGIAVTTYVVDSNGILIASSRMDGALSVSPVFAEAKAYTAGTIGLPTAKIAEYAGEGKPYNGVDNLDSGRFTTIAGGLPVKEGEALVGGIGVGGSYDVNQDVMCAEAALSVLG